MWGAGSVLRMSDYDTDVYAWSQRQGALLRRLAAGERVDDADLDWPNIAEEIETVGRSERSAVASHIATIIEHLIKLEASPTREPRAGWRVTIQSARLRIEKLLKDNPSLRPAADTLVAEEMETGRRLAEVAFEEHGETYLVDPQSLAYSKDQVMGDWLPDASQ
jgi:Domain of unknown function DUF29